MADLTTRRLVALLGHLTPGARIRIASLAEQVGTTEARLASDLLALATCGVAPYYPDDLMPLIIEDGFVSVFGELPALSGSIRLSVAEAAALASALQTAGFAAEDELTSRLLNAAASKNFDAEELEHTIRTATAPHDASVYEAIASALSTHAVTSIEYIRGGTELSGGREIEPETLFAERGAWYVTGWCRSAGDWRTFRVDRVRSADLTGEVFAPRAHAVTAGASAAFPPDALPFALLRFAPGEPFDEREWPGGHVLSALEDGSVDVEVPYAGTGWIARRVVARMGRVEVVEPADIRAAVSALAVAERARY